MRALTTIATAYSLVGVFFAFTLLIVMPAVNWKGATYYGVTWPLWVGSSVLKLPPPPIPAWAFTFD